MPQFIDCYAGDARTVCCHWAYPWRGALLLLPAAAFLTSISFSSGCAPQPTLALKLPFNRFQVNLVWAWRSLQWYSYCIASYWWVVYILAHQFRFGIMCRRSFIFQTGLKVTAHTALLYESQACASSHQFPFLNFLRHVKLVQTLVTWLAAFGR